MKKTTWNEYHIEPHEGEPPQGVQLLQVLGALGQIHTGTIDFEPFTQSIQQEERGLKALDTQGASMGFERNRRRVLEALQAIAGSVIEQYDLPTEKGVDIGSGATGAMVHDILRPNIQSSSWVEIEIQEEAVQENQRRHPDATIMQGSYHRLGEDFQLRDALPIITGLSSLDATHHIANAMQEIRNALQVGGFLFHIQDVRPGDDVTHREMVHMGYEPPYTIQGRDKSIFTVTTPENKVISVVELFRRNLSRAIEQTSGMEIVMNQWITAHKPLQDAEKTAWYHMNLYFEAEGVPERKGEYTSAVVTVARRTE